MSPASITSESLHHWLGAHLLVAGRCRFCVWSPNHNHVEVELVDQGRRVALTKATGGYHVGEVDRVTAGHRYALRIEGGMPRPDPASRFQPEGVHGPSQVITTDFAWTDRDWQGVPRAEWVIYELHLGTLTDEGTFLAAIDRLDELVELGITAVELMPLAESAGRWNWGYDGVHWFAPSRNFGVPDDLRRFVNAAHLKGLAVFLDVVYNHFGPEGNYLGEIGPYLSSRHTTPWGAAPNFDDPVHGPELRRFVVANAIHWFDEYHFDGLRVDAIHCMRDDNEPHIAAELSEVVRRWSAKTKRTAMLIAESNVYDPEMLKTREQGGIGFDAQWCDDFLHSVFAVVRPGEQLSSRNYRGGTDLRQTLQMGYVYEGTLRKPSVRRPFIDNRVDTRGLIYSIQNHDFIGNHPSGLRLHQLTSVETHRAAAALLLLSPAIPMLFMGEEFGCEQPFQFFVDFTDSDLRKAVVEGRRAEYPQHDWTGGREPIDPDAFDTSKIGPATRGDAMTRDWYRSLIQLRVRWRRSGLLDDHNLSVETKLNQGLFVLRYARGRTTATVAIRLVSDDQPTGELTFTAPGTVVLNSRPTVFPADKLLANHAKIWVDGNQEPGAI